MSLRRALMAAVMSALLAGMATNSLAQTPARGDSVAVFAAGSLRAGFTEVARAFEAQQGRRVAFTFGASGLLKERLEGGAAADVFASANMEHPQALRASGAAVEVLPFARNALCALVAPNFTLQGKPLAQRLIDADVRIGISTPRADPSGDYAFQMFERVESSGQGPAGSAQTLKTKALQLTGGPQSPPPPQGRNVYGVLMAEGQADLFVTYCTNAAQATAEVPSLRVIDIPETLNVVSTYGIALLHPKSSGAETFVSFLLGDQGQAILRKHGFSSPR